MTGVAEIYLFLRRPHSRDARTRLKALLRRKGQGKTRFVVLSWKRTGSNLLCGILHHHPEIAMHNELFNPIDIFTYYPSVTRRVSEDPNDKDLRWTHLARDLYPDGFLEHIWTGKYASGEEIKEGSKAVGFKSFPDHWPGKNEEIWRRAILEDHRIKKIVLCREDELAVFISMLRAEKTGHYMTLKYPKGLKVHIDPARFQAFVNNYRDTFQRKYKSPTEKRDTFRINYEQIVEEESFDENICPLLWRFLEVDDSVTPKRLKETVKQADDDENPSEIISSYEELEFCFRHTDVKPFSTWTSSNMSPAVNESAGKAKAAGSSAQEDKLRSRWSILLPICSRRTRSNTDNALHRDEIIANFNANRLSELVSSSQYSVADTFAEGECWTRLENFASSLKDTCTSQKLKDTVCVVGIDVDDKIFMSNHAKHRISDMLRPCKVVFVSISPIMYGHVCRIWSHLANKTGQHGDFVVLFGDDIVLETKGWQDRIEARFHEIAVRTGLPFGAACVALNDESFPGFPTFPVVHRWHIDHFDRLLPKQFVNQGGDPYLFELYSRWNASSFEMSCKLRNTLGGDSDARYEKYTINWPGQILTLSLMKLESFLGAGKPTGLCIDVVVPSYRCNNRSILEKIVSLRSTKHLNVRFWVVVDRPTESHLADVRRLATDMREKQEDGNYFVNVIHYSENRGASYARNTGYNYSTADWVLFLDDDVVPDDHILDAYAGAIYRYPDARVFVGQTSLPPPCNVWTDVLHASNVMYFYGIATHRVHPPWGVTANLLVRGSRLNRTIQFKDLYPKTGGGEDIDFVFQMKEWYGKEGNAMRTVVGVPGASASHPWWRGGRVCYKQIRGWAWGDSLCITEWPAKSYFCLPNWVEFIVCILPVIGYFSGNYNGALRSALFVTILDHSAKASTFYTTALTNPRNNGSLLRASLVALGASTVISSQEITRLLALIWRLSLFSFCRRMDWFDGQAKTQVLDIQLRAGVFFLTYFLVTCYLCEVSLDPIAVLLRCDCF